MSSYSFHLSSEFLRKLLNYISIAVSWNFSIARWVKMINIHRVLVTETWLKVHEFYNVHCNLILIFWLRLVPEGILLDKFFPNKLLDDFSIHYTILHQEYSLHLVHQFDDYFHQSLVLGQVALLMYILVFSYLYKNYKQH
jgi:hypothetical protein